MTHRSAAGPSSETRDSYSWRARIFLAAYCLSLLILGWIVYSADCAYGVTLSLPCEITVLSAAAVLSLPYLITSKWRTGVAGFAAFSLVLLTLTCMDPSAEKAMNRLSNRIQPGMPRAQVEQLVTAYFPPNGQFGTMSWEPVSLDSPEKEGTSPHWVLYNKAVVMTVSFGTNGQVTGTEVSD